MDLFKDVFPELREQGRPDTNKEIARQTGMTQKRVGDLKKHPGKATLAEMETLARLFKCQYVIGG